MSARGAAIAMGNFDGVHAGHKAVIASARRVALAQRLTLAALVFEPHPRRFLDPQAPPFLLQTSHQRERALAALAVSEVFEIGFDAKLAQLSDSEFAERILRDMLGVAHVSVGANFRFGKDRVGDASKLAALGVELGFSVDAVAAVRSDGERVSSSAIRRAIAAGDVAGAAHLLGRPWAIEAVVQRGFARGRDFGFPTANLALGAYIRPKLGIYAVRVSVDGETYPGVANIGVNPSVGALPAPLLEAHLFDFDADLYDKLIEVELIAYLRPEEKFDDLAALKQQMIADAQAAKIVLAG